MDVCLYTNLFVFVYYINFKIVLNSCCRQKLYICIILKYHEFVCLFMYEYKTIKINSNFYVQQNISILGRLLF